MVILMHNCRLFLSLLALLLLTACSRHATFDTRATTLTLTPQQAISETPTPLGKQVLWGGMIIQASNLPESTRLEVLAYPLDSSHTPRINQPPLGRFLLHHPEYMETIDYAAGRRITVLGKLTRIDEGMVDQSPYRFPVVESQQLHLWPRGEPQPPRIHFGIGVVFGR